MKRHCILHKVPARRWDEGLPLGNGVLGLLVWGDGNPLNLSIDRGDLWDNRPDPATTRQGYNWKTLTSLIDRNDMKSVYRRFEHQKDGTPYPTKIPCGRVRLQFGKSTVSRGFRSDLDFASAVSMTRIGNTTVTAYVHAREPLVVVRVRGARPKVDFLSPFDRRRDGENRDAGLCCEIARLGYPPIRRGRKDQVEFIVQQCAEGMTYSVAWTSIRTRGEWVLFLTVQMAHQGESPVPLALRTLAAAKQTGPVRLEKSHRAWWRGYWRAGHVSLPDQPIERLWYAEMYKLGACAREHTLPIALQGVWTADEMGLPPWRGDYHHDLNTQMTYWPVHTAGRIEQSLGFAKWLHRLLPAYRAFARDFYNAPGANVPCSHGANGEIVRGWAAYVYSRTNAAWLVQHLWWHYRYTMDEDFLRDLAWPFIRDVARFCAHALTKERDGQYHIHYSSSPEFYHNWRQSFAKDSTYDLSLIRYALETASNAARVLCTGLDEAQHWDRIRATLCPYPIAPQRPLWPLTERGLAIWEGQALVESHRHPAHCMSIFPLGDVNIEGSARDREIIAHTMLELLANGTGWWCGYSFSWYACLGARIRQPNRVLWGLHTYLRCFSSPNTFHLNGDFKQFGPSLYHYRPFTLEGNFGAAHAVNEMLLQSWGGKLRLFPAVPPEWKDVSFTDLRAEGAFRVSAWRKNGAFARAVVVSEKGQPVRLEHPAPGKTVTVTGVNRRFAPGKEIRFRTDPGRSYRIKPAR